MNVSAYVVFVGLLVLAAFSIALRPARYYLRRLWPVQFAEAEPPAVRRGAGLRGGMMLLELDPESSVPPYEQLRRAVIDGVHDGSLVAGVRLPPVRTLAEELGLAPNTVARAYRELERDGVIETRGRNGSFIATNGDPTEQQAQLAASAYAERIAQLGLDPSDALAIVSAALGLRR